MTLYKINLSCVYNSILSNFHSVASDVSLAGGEQGGDIGWYPAICPVVSRYGTTALPQITHYTNGGYHKPHTTPGSVPNFISGLLMLGRSPELAGWRAWRRCPRRGVPGDCGVPLPLAPGNICMVCATTAAPGAWGKEKVEASSRCLPLACSGTPQTLCLVVLQLRPFLLDLRFIPCLHFYLHHAAVEAEAGGRGGSLFLCLELVQRSLTEILNEMFRFI